MEYALLADRIDAIPGGRSNANRRRLLALMSWCLIRLRFFVLPMFVVGATAAIMLSDDLTSQSMVLNGLAIGFITLDCWPNSPHHAM
eukprot:SAG22_NODE_1311_length_4778_cov_14.573199_3_plen_87_part_00